MPVILTQARRLLAYALTLARQRSGAILLRLSPQYLRLLPRVPGAAADPFQRLHGVAALARSCGTQAERAPEHHVHAPAQPGVQKALHCPPLPMARIARATR